MPILAQTIILNVLIKEEDKNLKDMKLDFIVINEECSQLFNSIGAKKDRKMYSTYLKTDDELVDLHESLSCQIQVKNSEGLYDMARMKLNVNIEHSVERNPIFKKPLHEAINIDKRQIQHDPIETETMKNDGAQLILENDLSISAFGEENYIPTTIETSYQTAKASGKTVTAINAPTIPTFENQMYIADVKDDNTIEPIEIKLHSSSTDYTPIVIVESEYEANFEWRCDKLCSKYPLPANTFDSVDYITITLEAYFEPSKGSDKTIVIISAPEKIKAGNDQIPYFEKPIYTVPAKEDNTIEPTTIILHSPSEDKTSTVEILEPQFQDNFWWEDNKLSSKVPFPSDIFVPVGYITITLEAYYDKCKGSNKTIVIINAAEKNDEDPIPIFEKPMYIVDIKKHNTIEPITIILESPSENKTPTVEILEPQYQDNFTWEDNKLSSKVPLPPDTFLQVGFITITLEAYYDKSKGSSKTVVVINAAEKNDEDEDEIPIFEKPMHTADVNDDNTTGPIETKLDSPSTDKYSIAVNLEPEKIEEEKPKYIVDVKNDNTTGPIETKLDSPSTDKYPIAVNFEPENIEDEKPKYIVDVKNDNTIGPIETKLDSPSTDKYPIVVNLEPEYKANYEGRSSNDSSLPNTFDSVDYITIPFKASYENTKGLSKIVVIINIKEKIEEDKDLIPTFEKPKYIADVKEDNKITPIEINVDSPVKDKPLIVVILDSEYKANFEWQENRLVSTNPLLPNTFDSVDYITITLEAFYENSKGSSKTVVIINAPEKIEEDKDTIPSHAEVRSIATPESVLTLNELQNTHPIP